MNAAAIIALVTKGLSIAEQLWENRDLALKAIQSITNIVKSFNGGTVTQADIDQTEADLDALLDEFNAPLPPE